MDISYFMKLTVEKNASDIFLTADAAPHIKIEGKLYPLGKSVLTAKAVKRFAYSLMNEAQVQQFERDLEFNMAITLPEAGRFRINVFRERGEVGLVIRVIRNTIPTIEELNLPLALKEIVMAPRGLVLITGSAGSGKSTTLASMLDYRNTTSAGHILTIEDPIEYLHKHKKSIVNQREVGVDTHDFHSAIRNAMREVPDVIMIGEILDAQSMAAAISFAETGHLCLASLHSSNAELTIARVLNFFPESSHKSVLMNLSMNLKAIVSQRLLDSVENHRLPAVEMLTNTSTISDLLRRGDLHLIKKAMEDSLTQGMQTFDQSLFNLIKSGQVALEDALRAADAQDALMLKLRLSEGGTEATAAANNVVETEAVESEKKGEGFTGITHGFS